MEIEAGELQECHPWPFHLSATAMWRGPINTKANLEKMLNETSSVRICFLASHNSTQHLLPSGLWAFSIFSLMFEHKLTMPYPPNNQLTFMIQSTSQSSSRAARFS